MQRYYETDVNQTQCIPLQSSSPSEINKVFLHAWTDDLPSLAGGNQVACLHKAEITTSDSPRENTGLKKANARTRKIILSSHINKYAFCD